DVMRQLTWPAHAGVEGLTACIVTLAAVGCQEVMTPLRQGHDALPAVKRHEPRQALVTQMPEVRLTRIGRLVPRVAEVALRDHPECPNGRQRAAIITVQFVPMITVHDDLTFESA